MGFGFRSIDRTRLGVPSDIPKAISLYEKAAAQNFVAAQVRLGEIYLNGNLVAPDYAKAFALLETAARQGNPRGAMLLGQVYRFGLGTEADPIESYALVGSRRPGRTFPSPRPSATSPSRPCLRLIATKVLPVLPRS